MCSAVIACLTVALQSVLLVVPGTVHCHGKEHYHPTKAICVAGTAGKWEVEVPLPFHCTEVAKPKNSNDLPSWTIASEHTSVLVILEIKMGSSVSEVWTLLSQHVVLPGGRFSCRSQYWSFSHCLLHRGFLDVTNVQRKYQNGKR